MSGSACVFVIRPVVIKAGGPLDAGGVGKPAVSSARRAGEGLNLPFEVKLDDKKWEKIWSIHTGRIWMRIKLFMIVSLSFFVEPVRIRSRTRGAVALVHHVLRLRGHWMHETIIRV
jgi:hypothetical protein